MDLNIANKQAIICGASKGLGKACAMALAQENVHVLINARTAETLEETRDQIKSQTHAKVDMIACDVTTEIGQKTLLKEMPNPDILVNNAGGPPPGDFRDWDRKDWIKAIDANMLSAIFMIKATIDGMIERRFGRIVNITSGAVKAPIPILGLSNGARCGLTGFIAGLAREVASHNVTINNLLPGAFDTERLYKTFEAASQKTQTPIDTLIEARRQNSPAKRFGNPDEFGATCAFLCADQSGFITGQNILIDGGAYPGTL
ncbi:MAG: SDR family oxidoreductase [Pseudomonadota bacterium]